MNKKVVMEYMQGRLESINIERRKILTLLNQNVLEIEELNTKMAEMQKNYDEAYEIFSPKPRTVKLDKEGIAVLAEKQDDLNNENIQLKRQADELEHELEDILKSINVLDDEVVQKSVRDKDSFVKRYILNLKNQLYDQEEKLEKVKKKSDNKNTHNLLHEIKEMLPFDKRLTLSENIEEQVISLNKIYNDRIGVFYEGIRGEITLFKKIILLETIVSLLSELMLLYPNINVILKIKIKTNKVIVSVNTDKKQSIEFISIISKNIGNSKTDLFISDMLKLIEANYYIQTDDVYNQLIIEVEDSIE